MMKLCVILVLVLPVNSVFVYKFTLLSSCSDTVKEYQYLFTLDGNEIIFVDYSPMQLISKLPSFADPIDFPDLNELAINTRENCLRDIENLREVVGSPAEVRVPPQISIYPKHDVATGQQNNFICFMKNFFPPRMSVTWAKNGVLVTEGVYNSQFSLNEDGTFNSFSILTVSPGEEDEYSCTVEHEALDSPQTCAWDQPVTTPSVTLTVVLAVGIAVGILGLATAVLFIIKSSCSC